MPKLRMPIPGMPHPPSPPNPGRADLFCSDMPRPSSLPDAANGADSRMLASCQGDAYSTEEFGAPSFAKLLHQLAAQYEAIEAEKVFLKSDRERLWQENCLLRGVDPAACRPSWRTNHKLTSAPDLVNGIEKGTMCKEIPVAAEAPVATSTSAPRSSATMRRVGSQLLMPYEHQPSDCALGDDEEDPVRRPSTESTEKFEGNAVIAFLSQYASPVFYGFRREKLQKLEPKPVRVRDRARQILDSDRCELFVGALILMSTFLIALKIQYDGLQTGYDMGFGDYNEPADVAWPQADAIFRLLERIFTSIFVVELLLRFTAFGCKFFKHPLNYIDIVAVTVGVVDWISGNRDSAIFNPMMVRLMRFAKLARASRIARMSKMTHSLHFLIKCISASLSTLSWSVMLLLLIQCIAGMVMTQLVQDYMEDPDNDLQGREEVFVYYGTFTRSMITMFEVHLANWAPACRVLVQHVGEEVAYFFVAYRCLAGFAILSVINAVFVQQTMKVAQHDQEVMLLQKQKETERYARHLKQLFTALDTDNDNLITWDEIHAVVDDPRIKLWMNALDIDPHDLANVFKAIDINGDMSITHEELIAGASRIKGHAKSIDILHILAQNKMIEHKLDILVQAPALMQAFPLSQATLYTASSQLRSNELRAT